MPTVTVVAERGAGLSLSEMELLVGSVIVLALSLIHISEPTRP